MILRFLYDVVIGVPLDLSKEEREAMSRASELFVGPEDAPSCPDCGAIMVRNASCYRCMECGTTSGCS